MRKVFFTFVAVVVVGAWAPAVIQNLYIIVSYRYIIIGYIIRKKMNKARRRRRGTKNHDDPKTRFSGAEECAVCCYSFLLPLAYPRIQSAPITDNWYWIIFYENLTTRVQSRTIYILLFEHTTFFECFYVVLILLLLAGWLAYGNKRRRALCLVLFSEFPALNNDCYVVVGSSSSIITLRRSCVRFVHFTIILKFFQREVTLRFKGDFQQSSVFSSLYVMCDESSYI